MTNAGVRFVGLMTLVFLCVGFVGYVIFGGQKLEEEAGLSQSMPPVRCLKENETATYVIEGETLSSQGYARIQVKDSENNNTSEFSKEILQPGHYHPVELRKCGVYLIVGINHDYSIIEQQEGFRAELWKYDYGGDGAPVVRFSEVENGYRSYYTRDFRVSHDEQYIALERGTKGEDNYGLVIKSLDTLADVFVLPAKELAETYGLQGEMILGRWHDDGRHYIASVSAAMQTFGYYKVDTHDWLYQVWVAPEALRGGVERAFNFEGYLAYEDKTAITLVAEMTELLAEEARLNGEQKTLWLHNLETGEREVVAKAPMDWQFSIHWQDSETLQYAHPDGEVRQYKVD